MAINRRIADSLPEGLFGAVFEVKEKIFILMTGYGRQA